MIGKKKRKTAAGRKARGALRLLLITIIGILMFHFISAQEMSRRGHDAIGGEVLFLALPGIYCIMTSGGDPEEAEEDVKESGMPRRRGKL